MKKKELSYFAYRILSENTLHFILLCSSYPHPPKNNNKKRSPIKLEAAQLYLPLRSLKNYSFDFSHLIKKSPPHIPFSLLQTYISVIICIKTCKKYTFENEKKIKTKKSKRNQNTKKEKNESVTK